MTTPAAVILAGGRGQRLGGVVKTALRVDGMPILLRVVEALRGRVDPILLARGDLAAGALPTAPNLILLPGEGADRIGPVNGLAAAVLWCRSGTPAPELLLSVAGDTPFLPDDFAPMLLSALTAEIDVAVAAYQGNAYFTNALWRLDRLADLPQRLASGDLPHGLKGLIAAQNSIAVDFAASRGGDPFANVNAISDLVAAQRRARLHA